MPAPGALPDDGRVRQAAEEVGKAAMAGGVALGALRACGRGAPGEACGLHGLGAAQDRGASAGGLLDGRLADSGRDLAPPRHHRRVLRKRAVRAPRRSRRGGTGGRLARGRRRGVGPPHVCKVLASDRLARRCRQVCRRSCGSPRQRPPGNYRAGAAPRWVRQVLVRAPVGASSGRGPRRAGGGGAVVARLGDAPRSVRRLVGAGRRPLPGGRRPRGRSHTLPLKRHDG